MIFFTPNRFTSLYHSSTSVSDLSRPPISYFSPYCAGSFSTVFLRPRHHQLPFRAQQAGRGEWRGCRNRSRRAVRQSYRRTPQGAQRRILRTCTTSELVLTYRWSSIVEWSKIRRESSILFLLSKFVCFQDGVAVIAAFTRYSRKMPVVTFLTIHDVGIAVPMSQSPDFRCQYCPRVI